MYQVRPAAKTLIIGPGGGFDVARALASGSPSVTGVEINPIIANTIKATLPEGFQKAEYLLAHGMIDMVVKRHDMPATLARIVALLGNHPAAPVTAAA